MINIIVAVSTNNVIGKDNSLLWNQKNDLQRFKSLTYGHTIIMGRKTFESMGSKSLKGRENLIFSKNNNLFCNDLTLRLQCEENSEKEIFVIGGEEIYKIALPYTKKLFITEICGEFIGDAYFPKIDLNIWQLVSKEEYKKDNKNQYDYNFLTYMRK